MDREQVMSLLAMFFPDVSKTNTVLHRFHGVIFAPFIFITAFMISLFLKLKDGPVKDLVADEYLGTSGDRLKIRDGFTELLGDSFFAIPAIKTANSHRGNCEL